MADSNAAHTQEPWGTLRQYEGFVSTSQQVMDQNGYEFAMAVSKERARRIVACVNARKGIPTEALESGVVADLLAACRKIIDVVEDGDEMTAIEMARTALAKSA